MEKNNEDHVNKISLKSFYILKKDFKSRQLILLLLAVFISVIINLIITLCIVSSAINDPDTSIVEKTDDAGISDDTILSNLGLSKTKDYKEYNHDAYDYNYLTYWTLADGSIIANKYQLEAKIDFGPTNTLGIDDDLDSYIYIYDEETDKLIYDGGDNFLRDEFSCREYYTDREADSGVVYIVAYQVKDNKVFRKDTFTNIKIKNFTE